MTTLHIREQSEDAFLFAGASVAGVLKQTVMRHTPGKYGCFIRLIALSNRTVI